MRVTFLSVYGLTGFTLAAAVHLGSYLGAGMPPEHPLFWALHIGIFPLFFAFMFRLRHWQLWKPGLFGMPTTTLQWRPLLQYCPRWVPPLVVVLFIYAGVNFFSAMNHLSSGARVPAGTSIPPNQAVYTIRAFSGHWLIFYLVPALFFAFVPADARPGAGLIDKAVT